MARLPVTRAIRALRAAGVEFEGHLYRYVEKGGTRASSAALGAPEHAVIKTLVFEDDQKRPFIVLMHGDRQVSTRAAARARGVKTVRACAPAQADRHSGYQVGGTSPFGTRKAMPVLVSQGILDLPRIWINGGKRGFLVSMAPADIARVIEIELADLATPV